MILLARFNARSETGDFEILNKICNDIDLRLINKFLISKSLPIINNILPFKQHGNILVYYYNFNDILYIINSEDDKYKDTVRDKLINKILE